MKMLFEQIHFRLAFGLENLISSAHFKAREAMKQICSERKSMLNDESIQRLTQFVHHLEEKLVSVKIVQERLDQLITIVSKTHQSMIQDLIHIKTFLNQSILEQEEEIIPIDSTKSEWDDDDEDDDNNDWESSKLDECHRPRDFVIVDPPPSAGSKRPSSLKKSPEYPSAIKSPKSVTFSLEENLSSEQPKPVLSTFQFPDKEQSFIRFSLTPIINPIYLEKASFNELTAPMIPSLTTDDSKHNQSDRTSKVLKTNIRIHEIESKNGDYLRLLNISKTDDYDLSEHFLQQNIHSEPFCRFRFPLNTIIGPSQTLTIWCGREKNIIPQPPFVFLWKEQNKWETKPECITILAKPNGRSIAWYKNSSRAITDQSSSDILHVHTKTNPVPSDVSTSTSSSSSNITVLYPHTKPTRLTSYHIFGSTKPPFAHSPNNPIHPDHNGTNGYLPKDLRSQMHQKAKVSQLLNRPKSSPFASHMGCRQDLITMNFLRTQRLKQTTVKN